MFSYLVNKAGTLNGIDLSNQICAKTDGYWWITNHKEVAGGASPIPISLPDEYVIFSDIDVPVGSMSEYEYVNGKIQKKAAEIILAIKEAYAAKKASAIDIQNKLKQLREGLVTKSFDELSVAEKKLLVGLKPTPEEIDEAFDTSE